MTTSSSTISTSSNSFARKADISFKVSMAAYFLQCALVVLFTLVILPTHKAANPVMCVLQLLPLLMLLPWLLKRSIRAHIWLCFIILGYFMTSVLSAFMVEQYGQWPLLEVANTVVVFISSMLFSRWEQKRYAISVTR